MTRAIIFDFDGVIADSEVPANRALAESLTIIGLPTSFEDSLRDYYGHNWQETQRRIEAKLGGALPDNFRSMHRRNAREHFSKGFAPVIGASDFLDRTVQLPRAIASSSNVDYIRWALDNFGLHHHFADHIHSADGMARENRILISIYRPQRRWVSSQQTVWRSKIRRPERAQPLQLV